MAKYIIEGGVPLKGKIEILGAKNSGFKLLIAALLSDQTSVISNLANNSNVSWVSQSISELGGEINIVDAHVRSVSGRGVSKEILTNENTISRASSMFLPILLHRFGKAKVRVPSGDKIGKRPINMHIQGLESMGVKVTQEDNFIQVKSQKGIKATNFRFEKNTHTGTETLILAAVLANGKTTLENAAEEPEVDDLIDFLNKMGAKIKRFDGRTIEIDGVTRLDGTKHRVTPDRGEVVTFGCAALATKGDVTVLFGEKVDLKSFTDRVLKAGGGLEEAEDGTLRFFSRGGLKATNIETAPHPGFMTDWQSLWAILMTQASGESIIHETVFENRFAYVENLKKMGAKVEFFNPKVENPEKFYNFHWSTEAAFQPHAIKIYGPAKLHGSELKVSDIRAGATLVLAALAAEGRTVLNSIEHIERGYDNLEGRLETLGVKIKRVE